MQMWAGEALGLADMNRLIRRSFRPVFLWLAFIADPRNQTAYHVPRIGSGEG